MPSHKQGVGIVPDEIGYIVVLDFKGRSKWYSLSHGTWNTLKISIFGEVLYALTIQVRYGF